MPHSQWLKDCSPAFRLMVATSWLAPDSWRNEQEQAIREAVCAGVDWDEYLSLVCRHRTPALSWAALKRTPGWDAPEPVKRQLQLESDACRMQAVGHALLLADVLKRFEVDAIMGAPVKGPILSLALYEDVGLRQSNDLDIMVAPQDVRRAQESLRRLGWQPEESYASMTPRQWRAILENEHHAVYVRPKGTCRLELHWRNQWDSADQAADRWSRTQPSCWRGQSFQALNPIDVVLHLCSHGAEHEWSRAKWLGDMARIYSMGFVEWLAVREEARRSDQERPLLLCLELLREAYRFPVPIGQDDANSLPSFLTERAVAELRSKAKPASPVNRLWEVFRKERYLRLLRPHTSWRKSFAPISYCRLDFKVLPLPDRLFWAYTPLRPFLWFWRRLVRGGHSLSV